MALFGIKKGLKMFGTDAEVDILNGVADPAAGAGVAAVLGSMYLRENGLLYRKTGALDTDWVSANDVNGAGGGLQWSTISTNTIAVKGKGYILDSAAGVFTVTLPAAPALGDTIGFAGLGSIETNNVTIGMNSLKMNGATDDLLVDLNYCYFEIMYTGDATTGWVLSNTDESGNISNVQAFIGNFDNTDQAVTEFTEGNYVVGGDNLETAIDKLDMSLYDLATTVSGSNVDISNIEAFIGSGGSATPDYTTTNYILDGDDLEAAIGKLDAALNTIENIATTGVNWRAAIAAVTADVVLTTAAAYAGTDHFSDDDTPFWTHDQWADGDRVVSTNATTLGNIYRWDDAADQWVFVETLGNNDAVAVQYDFLDAPGSQEDGAAYMMNSDSTAMIKIADFDLESAATIGLSGGYTAGAGTISSADSVESAIQKLDGNMQANDQDITDINTNLSTLNTNITNVDTAHDNLAAAVLTENTTVVTASTNDVVLDTVTQSGNLGAKWFVIAYSGANRYAAEIYAMHDGATGADMTEYAILTIGTKLKIDFDVVADGTNMTLIADNRDTANTTIKSQRITVRTAAVNTTATLSALI